MTLDDAIEHANEVFNSQDICDKCRVEHLQLREWLNALRDARDILKKCPDLIEMSGSHASVLVDRIKQWNRCLDTIEQM